MIRHELKHVLVAGHDNGGEPLVRRLSRQRADDVVRFIAGESDHRNAKRFAHTQDVRDLPDQILRHRFPRRLVAFIHLVAHSGALDVQGHTDVIRLLLLDELAQHRGEAENCVGRQTLGGAQPLHGGIVGPVDMGHSVDKVKTLAAQAVSL